MKHVAQLDDNGYFFGMTVADESQLEPGVYHMPAGTIDAEAPIIPDGHLARWEDMWVFEPIPDPEPEPELEPVELTYRELRSMAYPFISEQLDMQYWDSVNGTTVWADTIASVKAMHPKPTEQP
jgi:hypothetical protein